MGGHPWYYFVPYQSDINQALQELRRREFLAGRYNPVTMFPNFPVTEQSVSPGRNHASIEEALEAADADGTRSILDVERVAEKRDFGVVAPLSQGQLMRSYGTFKPTRDLIEENMYANIERGQGIYIVVYKDSAPSEIFFAGYSYD